MKKSALILNTFLISALFLAFGARAVIAAPHLITDPSTGSFAVGADFSVTIKVDSGAEVAGAVDGLGTYDSAKLELVSAVKASPMVFESTESGGNCSINSSSAGKFSFLCYSNDTLNDKVINGNLVVLNFKAKATGTAVVNFTCANNSFTDSNIVKTATASDVIVCGENVGGSYIITAGAGGATTTTTTAVAAELPQTGGIASTVGLIVFGVISLASAFFLKFL